MVAICMNRRAGLGSEFDRLFQNFFNSFPARSAQVRPALPLNILESESGYTVEAELPGRKLEDIEILIKGRELTLKSSAAEVEEEGVKFHRRERVRQPFERMLRLPEDVNAEAVEARLENGVLTIELPKAEQAKPRRIEIR